MCLSPVPRRIAYISESHSRGMTSSVKRILQPCQSSNYTDSDGTKVRLPRRYQIDAHAAALLASNAEDADSGDSGNAAESDSVVEFTPPAEAAARNKFTILKFYSMSVPFVRAMLRADLRRKLGAPDSFPFTTDETEDHLINLVPSPPKSIIVIGRSGTGNTDNASSCFVQFIHCYCVCFDSYFIESK